MRMRERRVHGVYLTQIDDNQTTKKKDMVGLVLRSKKMLTGGVHRSKSTKDVLARRHGNRITD